MRRHPTALLFGPLNACGCTISSSERAAAGKCAGDIIVYKDKRNVMGSGTVLATAEEKRACEQALGRSEPDPDFPSYGVWRIE